MVLLKKMKERLNYSPIWVQRWWPVFLTIDAIILIGIVSLIWWGDIWSWAQGTGATDGETRGETLRNIALALGGIAAFVIGLPLAVWRSIVALEQTKIANEQARTAERGLNNERYQKGADMLGSDKLTTRIGGVYALERLVQEHSDEYHIQIMKLLCAFIRPPKKYLVHQPSYKVSEFPCPDDILAALEVIGQRGDKQIFIEQVGEPRSGLMSRLNLAYSNLSNVGLYEDNLSRTLLYGADLSNSFLVGVDFSLASLEYANLSKTQLKSANFLNANLQRTNLTCSDLSNAQGLTQEQLDYTTKWEGQGPPILDGAIDIKTGEQLIWRGRSVPHPSDISATDEDGKDK